MKILALLLMVAIPAYAADNSASSANATNAINSASKLIGDMEGVYKHRFSNGIITPGKAPGEADERYESEDIVEIVRYDDSHLYVRAELQFYNGHSCSIAGIAGYENGAFIYHDPSEPLEGEAACALKVSTTDKNLILTDRQDPKSAASCHMYCGMRGSLSDYSIPKSSKRKIRYMDRLKASNEYAKAVDDLKKSSAAK